MKKLSNDIEQYYNLFSNPKEQEEYNKNHFEALEEKDELDRLVKLRKIKLEKERINKIIEDLSRENKAITRRLR